MSTHPAPQHGQRSPHADGDVGHDFTPRSRMQRLRDWIDQQIARRRAGKLVFPVVTPDLSVAYPVTYPYGVPNSMYEAGRHTGEDHACPPGSFAMAVSWGTVTHAGPSSSWGAAYGIQVRIRTKNGRYEYAHNHLSEVLVAVGDQVEPGEVVGLTGATGNVTGPHDHLEARPAGGHYGSDVNPIRVKVSQRKAARRK